MFLVLSENLSCWSGMLQSQSFWQLEQETSVQSGSGDKESQEELTRAFQEI